MHCPIMGQLDIHCPVNGQSDIHCKIIGELDIHCPNIGKLDMHCPTIRQLNMHCPIIGQLDIHCLTVVQYYEFSIIHNTVYPVCKFTRGGKFIFLELKILFSICHETLRTEPKFTTEDGDNTFVNKRLFHFVSSFYRSAK